MYVRNEVGSFLLDVVYYCPFFTTFINRILLFEQKNNIQ